MYTYAQLQSIQPGVTRRDEILKTFGEPRDVDISDTYIEPNAPKVRLERLSYSRNSYVYGEPVGTEMLTIELTNGVVRAFQKSR